MDDAKNSAGPVGQRLTASDIKDRLIQEGDPRTLLMWPPNLFAFTSYILGLSGAYQLAVSPPADAAWPAELKRWPPTIELMREFLGHVEDPAVAAEANALVDRAAVMEKWMKDRDVDLKEDLRERLWTYLMRECGQEWRDRLPVKDDEFAPYREIILQGQLTKDESGKEFDPQIPIFLKACWLVFKRLCYDPPHAWDISYLLCNGDAGHDDDPPPPDLKRRWLASVALLSMHAIADETCIGWGIVADHEVPLTLGFPDRPTLAALYDEMQDESKDLDKRQASFRHTFTKQHATVTKSAAQRWAERGRLHEHGTLASINPYRGRVLPKRHTPDVGITLRSISSNLAFHRSAIDVVWSREPVIAGKGSNHRSPLADRMSLRKMGTRESESMTILLLPLPLEIMSRAFEPWTEQQPVEALSDYGFFTYKQSRRQIEEMEKTIRGALRKAQQEVGTVDMVILPEAALNDDEKLLWRIERELQAAGSEDHDPVSFYIAGVARPVTGKAFPQDNAVYFKSLVHAGDASRFMTRKELGEAGVKYFQNKHHRWQLNRPQLLQYGLTHKLSEKMKWWEAINVGKRRVSFINIGERLTVCPLICEDLARQDPIADLIRHVGPSLVVTILLDGPQHKDRWSSRYAGILSEDPGSAVVALTSFGMVRRWSASQRPLSRIVALWNDSDGPRELELASGASGILLTVGLKMEREPIADGRRELRGTSRLNLIDVVQINAD
jgi:hypothetical protein